MIYRNIICVMLTLLLIICFGCTRGTDKQSGAYGKKINMTHWVVYVNGAMIDGLPVSISSKNIRFPFVQMVDALGITVEKQSETIYIRNDGDTYVLCYSPSVSFVRQGDTDNLMIPVPGASSYYCRYELGDVFLDSETLDEVLYRMGIDIDISVDYVASTISIITK